MSPNPYQSPNDLREVGAPLNRTPFILAGIGALLASVYWGVLTLLIGFAAATGAVSAFQVILPCILIALYALRGYQLFKGDPAAAKRVLWLHGLGALMAVIQISSGDTIVKVLYGIKVAIHLFGVVTAYMATKAYAESQQSRM
jgi:hypothetical protein